MIPTVPTDIPVSFLLGVVLVGLAHRQIRATQPGVFSRYVLTATGFTTWFGLTVCYFYVTYPGWMWSYVIDTDRLPLIPSCVLFLLTLSVAGFTGGLAAQELIKANKGWWAVGLGLYGLVTWAAVMVGLGDEYAHIGTYATYHAGQALKMAGHPIQQAMTIAAVCEALPGLYLAWRFVTDGRKLGSQSV